MREPYHLTEEEIQILLQGVVLYGLDETFKRMQEKTMSALTQVDFLDDMIMDMHEAMLKRAREFDTSDEDGQVIQEQLYQLASMLRFSAHDAHRFLLSHGKASETGRFLKLVSCNKDIPKRTWRA